MIVGEPLICWLLEERSRKGREGSRIPCERASFQLGRPFQKEPWIIVCVEVKGSATLAVQPYKPKESKERGNTGPGSTRICRKSIPSRGADLTRAELPMISYPSVLDKGPRFSESYS